MAATFTWDANNIGANQTDGGGQWLGANQWWDADGSVNTNWISGSDAVFGNGGTGGTVTLGSATAVGSMTFNAYSGTYTIGTAGQTITSNGPITMNSTAGPVDIRSALVINAAQAWANSSSNALTITNSANANSLNYANQLTLNGGAFTFALTSSGTSTGLGGVVITNNSSVINASTNTPFGTGTLELNSGSITNSTTATNRTIGNAVNITGDFTFGSGGAGGTNTFSGVASTTGNRVLTVNTSQAIFNNATAFALGGNLQVNGTGGLAITSAGGITGTGNITINTSGAVASTFGTGPINVNGVIANVGSGTGTATLSGPLAATVQGLVQSGANSTLAVSASNTLFGGSVLLSAGTLTGSTGSTANVLNAFGTGVLTLNGGQLNLRASSSNSSSNSIIAGNNVVMGSSPVTINVNNNGANQTNTIVLGSLTIGSGQLNVSGSNSYALRFDGPTTLIADATINPTTANLTFNTAATIGESGGSFGITKIGSGRLTLNAANTFTGVLAALDGTLLLNNAAAAGAGTSAILLGDDNGGSASVALYAGEVNIARPIVVQGNNTGAVTIGTQSTTASTTSYTGNISLGSGGLRHDVALVTGNFHVMAYTGTISGLGALSTATGTSTSRILLNGNNSYSGGTLIQGATRVEHNNALGTGTVTISAGTLGSLAPNITISNGQMWTGNFTGGFASDGGGQNLTTTGTNTIAGGDRILSMNRANLTINGAITDDANSYSLTIRTAASDTANASLTLNGANTFDGGLIIVGPSSTRTLTVNAGNASALGTGVAALTNSSFSVLRLTAGLSTEGLTSAINAPVFTAGTGMTNGTYALNFAGGGGTGAAGSAVVSGGSITSVSITSYGRDYTSAPTISLTGAGGTGTITSSFLSSVVNLQGNTLTINSSGSNTSTFAGALTGTAGSLVKSNTGTQVLTGVSLYTGATNITGGTLTIGGAGSINGTSGVALNGATATLRYDSSVNLTKAVTFGANGGSLIYNESGTGYSGAALNVGANGLLGGSGKINGNATIAAGGKLSPGDVLNVLTVTNDLDISGATGDDAGALIFTVGSASGDQVVVGGTLTIGGLDAEDFSFSIANNAAPGTYVLFDGSLISGTIGNSAVSSGALIGTLSIDETNNDVVLNVSSVPEPASLGLIALGATGLLARRRRRL